MVCATTAWHGTDLIQQLEIANEVTTAWHGTDLIQQLEIANEATTTVHFTRNFTISADLPGGFSADHLRNPHTFAAECPRKRQRVSAESSKGIRGILTEYPRNRQRVSADLFKGISAVRIVKGVCAESRE